MSADFVVRPESGGLFELELFKSDDPEDQDGPSIMLQVTPPAVRTEPFAMTASAARRLALGLLEQVDAYERWQAENGTPQ